MVLLIDNYDSFTYMLRDYVMQAGHTCMVVRNEEMTIDEINQLQFDSIIISPGPKSPHEAGMTNDVIGAFFDTIPILGICLGHQALGEFFGAKLVAAAKPMHGKTSAIRLSSHPVFKGLPEQVNIMRYHSLILEHLPDELKIIAKTADDEIMAIAHGTKKIVGLQFHPESVLTDRGIDMIKNWFAFIQ